MFDIFGEMESAEELNKTAEGLKNEGDKENLYKLADENGIDRAEADLYFEGMTDAFCDVATAAIGKIEVEATQLNPVEIIADWTEYIKVSCLEDEELVTEKMTVSQIREIKEVEKEEKQAAEEQEQKNLPLLQLAEPEERKPEEPKTEKEQKDESEYKDPLESVLTAFWMEKDNAELYTKADAGILTPEIAAEEICPSGSRIYRNGTNMMFFYDFDKGAKLRSIKDRKPIITSYTYQEILDKTKELKMSFEQTEESEIINAEQPENVLHSDKEAQPDKEPHQKTVATSQEKQEEPYIPMDGQTSIADMQEIMPKELKETAANTQENTIDGEYRELMPHQDEKTKTEKSQYAQIEIKNALSYFEMEIRRMDGISSKETVKSRNYKIALECIRRYYQDIK